MTETLTVIREVPLSKLVPSEKNVRRTRRDAGLEELAASIAAHGLLQSLSVRPVLDKDGTETGKYAVSGGGRRLAALLDRLTLQKLGGIATEVRGEGWKWAQAFLDYPHAHGLRRVYPQAVDLPPEDQAGLDAAQAEYDALSLDYESAEELPEEVDARMGTLEAEIERLSERQQAYDGADIARGGVFVILNHDGTARIERGFIRPEDEAPEPEAEDAEGERYAVTEDGEIIEAEPDGTPAPDAEEDDDGKPLSDSLVLDLTAHRTLGLRLALGEQPDVALLAVIHALAVQTFYGSAEAKVLDIHLTSESLAGHADGRLEKPSQRDRLVIRFSGYGNGGEDDRAAWIF